MHEMKQPLDTGSTPVLSTNEEQTIPSFTNIMDMMQVKLRLEAIAIVLAHRAVLSAKLFIEAMAKATALSKGPNGHWDEIPPAVFGGMANVELYTSRLERRACIHAVLMDTKTPEWFRISFVEEWDRDGVELKDLVRSWNEKAKTFDSELVLTYKALEKGSLGKKQA